MEENFRITPIRNHLNQLLTVAQNIEPSNIIVAPNGRVAYVALAVRIVEEKIVNNKKIVFNKM